MTDDNVTRKWAKPNAAAATETIPAVVPAGGRGVRSVLRELRLRFGAAARSAARNKRLYAVDLTLSAFALVLAAILRLGPIEIASNPTTVKLLAGFTAIFVAICAITFPAAGLYKRKWKYASIIDYIALFQAILIASLILTTCVFFSSGLTIIPHAIIAIEIMTLTSLLAAVRLTFRQEDLRTLVPRARRTLADLGSRVPVLLVGTGKEADHYLRALQRDSTSTYSPVGFIDDSSAEIGAMLRGVPVLGTMEEFESVVTELGRAWPEAAPPDLHGAAVDIRKRRDSRAPYRDGRQDGHGSVAVESRDGASQHP